MSDHYCCKRCGLRYDDCKCKPPPSPKKKKVEIGYADAMKSTGFSASAVKAQEEFWQRMGITGIKVGSTTLKIGKKK